MTRCTTPGCTRTALYHGYDVCPDHYQSQIDQLLATGITYRQLDYWTSRGYLKADIANPGSGAWRRWSADEQSVARRMLALINAGMSVRSAARVARETPGTVQLADGITLRLEAEHQDVQAAIRRHPAGRQR